MVADGNSMTNGPIPDDAKEVREVPVLIVGGGPSGLLLAYLLSKLGGMAGQYVRDMIMVAD